jgi:hypothetical protein
MGELRGGRPNLEALHTVALPCRPTPTVYQQYMTPLTRYTKGVGKGSHAWLPIPYTLIFCAGMSGIALHRHWVLPEGALRTWVMTSRGRRTSACSSFLELLKPCSGPTTAPQAVWMLAA